MDDITINSISDGLSAPVSSAAPAQDDLEGSVKLFQSKLMEELGFDKLEEAEKFDIEQKLAKLVNDRIINLILIYLPEEKASELNELLEKEDQNGVLSLVQESIPGIEEKLTNELMLLRRELLVKMN